jgi:hypothetical protein
MSMKRDLNFAFGGDTQLSHLHNIKLQVTAKK